MKCVLAGVAVVAAAWIATPWVCMKRHGSIDERTLGSWADVEIPAPRRPVEDDESATAADPGSR